MELNNMMSITEAANYCASKVEDFNLNAKSISRKLYEGINSGIIAGDTYTPQFGRETVVISKDEVEKFIESDSFSHIVDVQRKKDIKKNIKNGNIPATNIQTNAINGSIIIRENKPVVGDIFIGSDDSGFKSDSLLLVTKTANNAVLVEEITTQRSQEINSGDIKSPCAFARSINEMNKYNYYGNSMNMAIAANRLNNNYVYSF